MKEVEIPESAGAAIWEVLTMYRLLSAEDFVGDAEKVTP